MKWIAKLTNKVVKQLRLLPEDVVLVTQLLVAELEQVGPILYTWAHYGKLYGRKNEANYHCHLMKGNPTYVACWKVLNKTERLIEVYYVGTHEKAPY